MSLGLDPPKGTASRPAAVRRHPPRSPDEMIAAFEHFLEVLIHDIRSPLTAAAGYAETLQRARLQLDEGRQEEMLDGIRRSLGRLADITAAVERLQTLRRQLGRTEAEPADVRALLERVAAGTQAAPALYLGQEPVFAPVRHAFVELAVRELLDNVVDHAPLGTSSRLLLNVVDGGLLIAVEDDGPGVPDEVRDRIFSPFDRGHAPSSRGGFGLGLAIVEAVAVSHGGAAWVEDRPAGWVSFRMFLRPGS